MMDLNRYRPEDFMRRGYFHCFNLKCVKTSRGTITMKEVTMTDTDWARLHPTHVDFLRQRGYYEHIVANRAAGRK